MTREVKALAAGLVAALFVVGASYGVSMAVTHGQPTDAKESQSAPLSKSTIATTQLIPTGFALYGQYCANCHGNKAQGGFGPTLHHIGDPDAKVAASIANGFPPRMPAFKKKLNAAQLQALTAYVQSLE